MGKLVLHITCGVEAPTKATLAMLIGKAAVADGHEVSAFFAGDAVSLLRPVTVDAVAGVGIGTFKEHLDAFVAGGGKLFASKLSGVARGIGDGDVGGLPVTLSAPTDLIRLSLESDAVLSY